MKLRKLARLCEHDRMEQHQTDTGDLSKPFSFTICPGGVFLPDDTLIIEPEKCGKCKGSGEVLYNRYNNEYTACSTCHGTGKVYSLDALTVREST